MGRISILEGHHHLKAPTANSKTLELSKFPPPAAMTIAHTIWEDLMKNNVMKPA